MVKVAENEVEEPATTADMFPVRYVDRNSPPNKHTRLP